MRKIFIILFTGCFIGWSATALQAQATVSGRVVDKETGKPLVGANVYLSGTTVGTATNLSGVYLIRPVPPGGYRLVVSRIGYATRITDLVIGPGESREINTELKPVVYQLPDIYVGDLNEKWEKNLQQFINHFVGETPWADSVEIINPEVLRFDKSWWGRLTAEALAPLQIENKALGYRITYHLKEFKYSGGRTRWDGEPLFTEMSAANSIQAAYWKENRKKAFFGSLRHFLLATLDDRLDKEGFIVSSMQEPAYGFASPKRTTTSADRLISEGDEPYLYKMNFFDRLEILYRNEEEDPGYVRWRKKRRGAANMQTSYLELNEHPVTVDSDGEIIQPYGATQLGYFSYIRLTHLTPRQYRPEGYPENDE